MCTVQFARIHISFYNLYISVKYGTCCICMFNYYIIISWIQNLCLFPMPVISFEFVDKLLVGRKINPIYFWEIYSSLWSEVYSLSQAKVALMMRAWSWMDRVARVFTLHKTHPVPYYFNWFHPNYMESACHIYIWLEYWENSQSKRVNSITSGTYDEKKPFGLVDLTILAENSSS